MEIFSSVLLASFAWLIKQYASMLIERRKSKQEKYESILTNLSGLTVSEADRVRVEKFIETDRLLWLFAPDDVVRNSQDFIQGVVEGSSQDEHERRLQKLILSLRQDIYNPLPLTDVRGTKLNADEFKLRGVGPALGLPKQCPPPQHASAGAAPG